MASRMKLPNLSPESGILRAGDILACSGGSFQSDFINLVTYGVPRRSASHLMILAEHNDDLLIFESTTGCALPCALFHRRFNGTQAHFLESRLTEYDGRVWHYPLAKPLRSFERRRLSRFLIDSLGTPYDNRGATAAGGKLWSLVKASLHQESISALFCSEWVAAALRHIERFDTRNVSAWSPNALIREMNRRALLGRPGRVK